jgi:RimJ/RimL family protein N-acetyltransferase
LSTERLLLTPLEPDADAPALHAMLSDPAVHEFDTDARPSASIAETEHRLRLQVLANGGTSWAISPRGGSPVGTIGIFADQGTSIRGVGWSLIRSQWGKGIMREAARAAIPFLLEQDGVDGLEAWVDSRNAASLGVARAAGMTERARLPRVYDDHIAQTVVMARAADDSDPEVFNAVATLEVENLPETVCLLQKVLRLHVAWAVPDPPVLAFLAVEPWSGSAGFRVVETADPIAATSLSFDVGVAVDAVRDRAAAAGLDVTEEPANQPWFRRELTFRLPEGHRITVSGPTLPPGRHPS